MGGIVGYYADSVEGPGMWLGWGMTGVRPSGQVDPDELRRVLLGQHIMFPTRPDQHLGVPGDQRLERYGALVPLDCA